METDDKEAGKQEEGSKQSADAKQSKEPEAMSYKLDNPSRVVPGQQKFVAWDEASRWRPIQSGHPISGVLVVKDTRPGQLHT
jgi:hypothetical protein